MNSMNPIPETIRYNANWKIFILLFFGLIFFCIAAYFVSGGTHGSIKKYQYLVSKSDLETAVDKVITSASVVSRDSVQDYYNDGVNYTTITIRQPDTMYRYIFRYYGDSTFWRVSPDFSELSICYAHDDFGNGGSEGNGKVNWLHWKLRKRLVKPFEREFISRLDSVLQLKHIDPD